MSTKSIFATGLDAGSTYTRCVISLLEDQHLRLVGYGSVPSRGWSKSRITDQQAVSECVLAAVEQAEAMAGTAIETVVAGLGGLTARGANGRGRMDFGRPREVEQRDINRAMDRAMHIQLQEDRMVLQLLPQDFVVDDQPGFHDPRNMMASVIEANAHLITISAQEHSNLVGAINRAHLSVDETVYEAIAACYASVLPSDRRDGVALVDIGAHSTEVVCYYGESAQIVASLRICGDHFSRDIAHAFRIPVESAAIVKHEFGGAVSQGTAENSTMELPLVEAHGREAREAPRKMLNEILESRTVELFEMVRAELARAGMQRAISSGLVIAGGGALLPGICDVAERVMECPARIGLAQGFRNWPEKLNDPAWTTAAGLSMYAARLRSQVDLERQSVGMLAAFCADRPNNFQLSQELIPMDDLKYELQEETRKGARIKVIGVGGGGSNAVGRMYEEGLDGVEFYVMNTDAQALQASKVPNRIQIGSRVTDGLGAGSDPAIGRQAALEDTERILSILEGADLVFITAGLGGGTGAGAAPVIATLAKQLDALTIAVVTKPFTFEGGKRMRQAERSVDDLASSVDILTTIPNDRLLTIAPKGTSMAQAFKLADDVLRQAVQGISEIILTPGLINLDFSDIKAAISGMGHALIGNAVARGQNAAVEAARAAINSPLLEDTRIKGARQVLMNITASGEIGLHELNEACSIIREAADCDDLQLNFGVIADAAMGDTVKVTVIATGFAKPEEKRESIIEARPATEFFTERALETAPAPPAPVIPEPVVEEPMPMAGAAVFEEELDVPAYLRQGKLLN